ncbi:FAD-dependent oxidoreductase [Vulcanisaeta thermophila]|uniref:FAD-dependent oxidoreductase n=1 Tax=Vulcanisaeta thermophila TaxID=867917 RepID=UPI000852BCD0|nr:FAD-dependent oxidoreductase [Vulcanisaeta thermophila]
MRVVIIGGGVIGTLLGALLTINDVNFVIVDADLQRPRAPLIHSVLLRIPSDVELARISRDVYGEISQYFNVDIMVDVPSITIVPSSCFGELKNLINLWNSAGAKMEFIEERHAIRGVVNGEVMVMARGGDHLIRIQRLMERLRERPNFIRGRASLKLVGNELRVIVNGEVLKGDYVILASGAWNSLLIKSLGLNAPLKPYKCQAAAFMTMRGLGFIVYDYVLGMYMRPLDATAFREHIVVAGDGNAAIKGLGAGDGVDPWFTEEITRKVRLRLGVALPVASRYGYCELTPDTLPLVGPWGVDDLYVIGGFDGYAAEVGPALAKALVNYIIRGTWDDYAKAYLTTRFLGGWPSDWGIGVEAHELCVG